MRIQRSSGTKNLTITERQQANNRMERGYLEEALNAENAISDDSLRKQSSGRVVHDSFTQGTSAQRMKWFKKGYETDDLRQGDTFSTSDL